MEKEEKIKAQPKDSKYNSFSKSKQQNRRENINKEIIHKNFPQLKSHKFPD